MHHNVHEMKIWHKAIDLVVDVYKLTSNFPKEEKFGLITEEEVQPILHKLDEVQKMTYAFQSKLNKAA